MVVSRLEIVNVWVVGADAPTMKELLSAVSDTNDGRVGPAPHCSTNELWERSTAKNPLLVKVVSVVGLSVRRSRTPASQAMTELLVKVAGFFLERWW